MKRSNTESKIRKTAKDQKTDPPSFVWNNINRELHPMESKRRYIIWLLGFVLIGGGAIISINNIGTNKNDNYTKKISLQSSQVNSEEEKTATIFENHNYIEQNEISKKENKSTLYATNNIIQQKINIKSINGIQYQLDKGDPKNTSNTISENPYIVNHNFDILRSNTSTSSSVFSKETSSLEMESRINYNYTSVTTLELKSLTHNRKALPYIEYPKTETEFDIRPFIEFGLLGGIHSINISQGQDQNLSNLRRNSESSWYSTGAYSHFGLNLSNHWHLSFGLEWITSKDKFEHKKEGVTKMIVTFDPSSGSAIDTSFVSGTILDRGDITLHMIDIPISLGYTISKSKWEFGAEATALLNIKTVVEGKALSNNEMGSSLNGQENIYNNYFGIGFKGSLLIGRKINDDYTLRIRPSYKTYLNSINRDGYALPTRYNLFSLSVGLQKKF